MNLLYVSAPVPLHEFCPVADTDLHRCISTSDLDLIYRSLRMGMGVGLQSILLLCVMRLLWCVSAFRLL